MKHFKLSGDETTLEFDLPDDQVIFLYAVKELDYDIVKSNPNTKVTTYKLLNQRRINNFTGKEEGESGHE